MEGEACRKGGVSEGRRVSDGQLIHRPSFPGIAVDENTSVAGMKDALRILPSLVAAVSAVAARAPVLRESAKKYRMVAQSRAWGEVVSGTLSGEVEVLRTAALAGLSIPDAARARASVEAGLPALLDALSAARHARQWSDRLPPQARANAEQSQARVCAEATSWLLLAR